MTGHISHDDDDDDDDVLLVLPGNVSPNNWAVKSLANKSLTSASKTCNVFKYIIYLCKLYTGF